MNVNFPVIKKKNRFTFQAAIENEIVLNEHFVKISSVPLSNFEVTETNFLNGNHYISGITTRNEITITFHNDSNEENLINFLGKCYDFPFFTGVLKKYSGAGECEETFILEECCAQSINFGYLNFSSSECFDIEVLICYQRVVFIPRELEQTEDNSNDSHIEIVLSE